MVAGSEDEEGPLRFEGKVEIVEVDFGSNSGVDDGKDNCDDEHDDDNADDTSAGAVESPKALCCWRFRVCAAERRTESKRTSDI